jgi:hypothetical protein
VGLGENEKVIVNTVANKVAELQQLLDSVSRLLSQNDIDPTAWNNPALSSPLWGREQALKEAIKEAIDELEESRKSFKSKRLELLRKKLTQVLLDVN